MMIYLCYLYIFIAINALASLSLPKNSNDMVAKVQQKLAERDIGQINTRLKVEGALIRPFYLYFSHSFSGESLIPQIIAKEVRDIVDRDLAISGSFAMVNHSGIVNHNLLKAKGVEGISSLSLTIKNDKIMALIVNTNLITNKSMSQTLSSSYQDKRKLSHHIAYHIFKAFIGEENLFFTQIAAVKREGINSQIVLMDFDGENEIVISKESFSKSCPYFSPNGKTILYGVVSKDMRGIVEQEIGKNTFYFRSKRPGLNLDPRILPDNSAMLATLSLENNAHIYKLSRYSGQVIAKLTNGIGLNLSPSISPDGSEMAFVSDRSGTPQIYLQKLSPNAHATRLSFHGKYNQTPHFSHDGRFIAFTGMDEHKNFDIFILDRRDNPPSITRVTQNQGRNQEPHFSPSGRFIIFTSERENNNKPDIFIATLNGSHQYRLSKAQKNTGYYSPVMRIFTSSY